MAETGTFAWLIEGDGNYWDGKYVDSRGFVTDVNKALRFARREDAETVKHWLLKDHAFALRSVKHGWTVNDGDNYERAKE